MDNRGPQVGGLSAFFLVFSTIAVGLRCYCRLVIAKNFGTDDYLAVAAYVFFMLFCVFAILGVQYGTGRHYADIMPQSNIPIALKWWWACEPTYVLSNMALKFSIGIFLLRIAVPKYQKWTIYVVMVVSGIACSYFFLLFIFQCWPVSFFWGRYAGETEGHCIDPQITIRSTYAYSAVSCWSDWTYCIIPTIMVWNLKLNIRTKISVIMLLALSTVASAATIVRFPYINSFNEVDDFLYATTDVALCSISETGLGIVASCLATLRPLFRNFFSRSTLMGGTSAHSSNPLSKKSQYSSAGYVRSDDNGTVDEEIGLSYVAPTTRPDKTVIKGGDMYL